MGVKMKTRPMLTAAVVASLAKVYIFIWLSSVDIILYSRSDMNVRYSQIINFFAVLIEVQLHALEEASHISWRFQNTNCKSDDDLEVGGNRVYKTNCNLALGQSYTLECKNLGDGWWKSNNLLVENYVYCEYTKGTTLTNITITGNAHTSQIVLSLLIDFYNFDSNYS